MLKPGLRLRLQTDCSAGEHVAVAPAHLQHRQVQARHCGHQTVRQPIDAPHHQVPGRQLAAQRGRMQRRVLGLPAVAALQVPELASCTNPSTRVWSTYIGNVEAAPAHVCKDTQHGMESAARQEPSLT